MRPSAAWNSGSVPRPSPRTARARPPCARGVAEQAEAAPVRVRGEDARLRRAANSRLCCCRPSVDTSRARRGPAVGHGRGAESGLELLGHGGAAHDVAPFEQDRREVALRRAGLRPRARCPVRRRSRRRRPFTERLPRPSAPRAPRGGRSAHDAAARVRRRPAQVEARERGAVARPAGHRSQEEQLLEAQLALEDVAFA